MSTKHTPGPWECVADAADGKRAIYGGDGAYRVATVHNFNGGAANLANARVIAAAPDLLAALVAAMAFIDSHAADPDITKKMRETYKALIAAQPHGAIAKATGGTS